MKEIAWNFINLIIHGYFPTDSQLRELKGLGFNGEVVTQTECLKEIYSRLRKFDFIKNKNEYKKNSRSKLIRALQLSKNSLEKIVISKYPKVRKILEEMRLIKNSQLLRVTGSGSACFALFLTKKDGDLALRQIKKKFPNYWCVLCKSI